MIFAMMLPIVIILGLGAVQLSQVQSDRSITQDVADSAALWGARQLSVAPTGSDQRTQAYASEQLGGIAANAKVTVAANIIDEATIKVAALADEKVVAKMAGKTVVKVIVVPGKLVNIVVR